MDIQKLDIKEVKDLLKEKGIEFHPATGLEKLRNKLQNALVDEKTGITDTTTIVTEDTTVPIVTEKPPEQPPVIEKVLAPVIVLTPEEIREKRLARRKREAAKLVRVNISCMNPNKSDVKAELFSAGSAKIGTFKKLVPFNTTEGFHVPNIILSMIKERRCSVFFEIKGPKGKIKKQKQVAEFSIEILDPLTPDELNELAQRQALSGSFTDDM